MCTIAGYAGTKRAAPILIEMMRRQEYMDSGLSTGIATIHEGKLYYTKVVGDLDELLKNTDAADFPGTVGIIHSRTPGDHLSHAHPFLSADKDAAFVLNGTFNTAKCPEFVSNFTAAANDLYNKGIRYDSEIDNSRYKLPLPNGKGYHPSEFYALSVGEAVKNTRKEDMAHEIVEAFRDLLERFPADIIMLGVHARLDNTVTVGTITRPMSCALGDGETYLATSAISFPDDIQKRPIISIPPTSVSQITPQGLNILYTSLEGTKVEQIDYRVAAYVYDAMEKILTGKENDPVAIPEMPARKEWLEVWSEPKMDCKYAFPEGYLKSYATILYECLWSFQKQGRLHSRIVTNEKGRKFLKFWLD